MKYQGYNKRIGAYVKYKFIGQKVEITDVKQREPKKPFKGVKITRRRMPGE